ncbi:hypothetical protein JAAARDRAFT_60054 [Jaapia argillacea MUCL 33604]|uniref:Uncharacterized protein n=1 Tax=Jaapia argillacea MUCL 33604 TaxID=933084 RepID=A0A067PMN5_9AGAM|nr:hypothetical protein JAAARDRAFT_60054 [Jaapia argillacea MUCL 33604]
MKVILSSVLLLLAAFATSAVATPYVTVGPPCTKQCPPKTYLCVGPCECLTSGQACPL